MRVGVLVSGNGTNLQALLDAQAARELAPAHIAVVISNIADAPALARAAAAQVTTHTVPHTAFASRQAFEAAVHEHLHAADIDLVVLAGFMRILSPWFVQHYLGRIINTHPSLLPAFVGKDAPAQAIAAGVKVSGVTVHFVDDSLDGGPIIAQQCVHVQPTDTAATLHQRIQREEHALLPRVVRALARGEIAVRNGLAQWSSGASNA